MTAQPSLTTAARTGHPSARFTADEVRVQLSVRTCTMSTHAQSHGGRESAGLPPRKKKHGLPGGPGRRGMREKAHSRHRPPPEMESKSISNSTSCTHKSYLAPTPRVSLSVVPRACSCLRQAGVGPPGSSQCILLHTASSTPVTKQVPRLFLAYIVIISAKKRVQLHDTFLILITLRPRYN